MNERSVVGYDLKTIASLLRQLSNAPQGGLSNARIDEVKL
ncbi:UNVERIFIED_ORG: hypothetical protein GGI63_003782 [Rhizobium esperanzae]